ncbi:DEAD/DEAH box helicase family protein [Streptomyces sp. IBSBF 2953]|nr:DEAD/DEAH box helicase family protein [Streptomyces hayashii]
MPSISPPALWSHQQDTVRCAVNELDTAGRTTLVMACGTGKTRTASEGARKRVHPAAGRVLSAATYLELLARTLREWRQVFGDEVLGQIIAVRSARTSWMTTAPIPLFLPICSETPTGSPW